MRGTWLHLGTCAVLMVMAVTATSEDKDECSRLDTCGACILTPYCYWCSSPITGNSKCVNHNKTLIEGWCKDGEPILLKTSVKEYHPGNSTSQILPENVTVSLRVREEFKFQVTYRKLDDYPVDLYYLMDLSASMRDDKENLSKLGDKLAAAMMNVTSNFNLGFGSFVDKVAMPFVNTHPSKLAHPCEDCVKPYSFKNHMPLTNKTGLFSKKVAETPVSGNVDHPEGGFDALMQAIVCKEEIKWRRHARHLLVMATDASFHIAGDGKLAGIVEPNDEQCHMTNHEYTHGLIYDYPSISQLARQAHKNFITLIFAVTKEQERHYKNLAEEIQDSSIGTLSQGSQNVIQLVLDVYHKLVGTVQMTDDSANKGVSVTYRTRCLGTGNIEKKHTCDGIHSKENVTFEVTIKALKCPPHAGEIWHETITISPSGIDEKTVVHLEVQCGCACEQEGNTGYEKNSESCKNHGDKKCGVCHCHEDYTGHACECERNQFTKKESVDGCITNADTNETCNNRGSCVCNVCKCTQRRNPNEIVSGQFCECDNFSCVRFEGKICSGREKGICECGKCLCNDGWKGDDCNCRDSTQTCKAPGDETLCSGSGECVCGSCICNNKYSGQFCEDCLTCPGGLCRTLAKCVEYDVHGTGNYDKESCIPKNITIKERREHVEDKGLQDGERYCKHPDEAGCSFIFVYKEVVGGFEVIAQEEKECPAVVGLLGIVFGVIGGTVLIGLITILIWKLLTSIHDRREFAKFEKERAQSKWERGDNPLYVQATSTFSNPTFSGN